MKTKSKLLTLLLTLALLCGLFTMIVANAATPEGGDEKVLPSVGFGVNYNHGTDKVYEEANYEAFGRSGLVTAVDGEARYRYVATPTTISSGITMNPNSSFLNIGAPFKTVYTPATMKYFSYEMDVSFENVPATGVLSLNVRYYNNGKDAPTNSVALTLQNVNGKLAITIGGQTYAKHFDELEWVHIAWVVGVNAEDTSKCPATLYVDGEPFYTCEGFFNQQNVYKTGDLRFEPNKSTTVNVPDATMLFQNFRSYAFAEESTELAAFAKGEKNMNVAPGTYKQVVYDNSYVYPSSAKTAVASVDGVKYATVNEAIEKANGATVTLLAPVLGTTEITTPCVINTNDKSFAYTTDLGVTKSEKLLTFADDENVVKFVFTKDGEELGTKTYGLGAIPDVLASGLTIEWDTFHYYKVDSWTVDGEAADEWTMPTLITEDMLGKTVTVDLVGAKQVFATMAYGSTVQYFYVTEDDTTGEDLQAALLSAAAVTSNGTITVTYRASVENSYSLTIGGTESTVAIYVDVNGQTLDGFYTRDKNKNKVYTADFFNVKTKCTMYVYSSKPGAVVKTNGNFTYNYSRSNTFNVGTVSKDGVWNSGDNLTVYAARLFSHGTYNGAGQALYYNVNGGTYHLGVMLPDGFAGNRGGIFTDNYASMTTAVNDATVYLENNGLFLLGAGADRTMNTTISNSEFHLATGTNLIGASTKATGTVTITASKMSGAKLKVPTTGGLAVKLGQHTVLTVMPEDGVAVADNMVLARVGGSGDLYRVILASRAVQVTRATETDPTTGEVLETETSYWTAGESVFPDGLDYHYTHSTTDATKVLYPLTWSISDGANEEILTSSYLLSAGSSYTMKPATYEEKSVALTVTTKDGIMTNLTAGTEEELHTAAEMTEANLTLRLYKDFIGDEKLITRILLNGANKQFDMNGHTIATDRNQDGFFSANVDKETVYVFSSRPGAQMLMTNKRSSDKTNNIEWGGGFAFSENGSGKNLTVGRTVDGKTFNRANLTIKGTCLVKVMTSTVIIDSITHNDWVGDNSGQIQFAGTGGTVEILNCDYISAVNTSLIAARSGSGTWNVTFRNCNISLTASITGAHSSVTSTSDVNILFENSVLLTQASSTAANALLPVVFGEGTKTNFTLNANISRPENMGYARISDTVTFNNRTAIYEVVSEEEQAEVKWTHGDLVLATEVWKKGSTPSFAETSAFGDFYFGAAKAKTAIDADKEYNLALKSKVSKIRSNLTLYSNISFNLFLSDEAIKTVTVVIPDAENEGETKTLTLDALRDETIGETLYKVYKIDEISPKDLTKTFEIRLTLENDGKTYTYAVTTSIATYAKSVLNNADECKEGKDLVASLIDYVREAALYFKTATEEDTVMQTMKTLLDTYGYTRPEWTKGTVYEIPAGNTLVTGAALNLGNTPGFLFFVGDNVTEVTVKYGNITKTFTGEEIKQYETADGAKSAILVDTIHASAFRGTITVTATVGETTETLEYNLDTYIQGVMDKNTLTEAPAYAQALYAYSAASEAYLNR